MSHGTQPAKMSAKLLLATLVLGVLLSSSNAYNPWDLMNQRVSSMVRSIFDRVQDTIERQQARMRNLQRNLDTITDQDNGYYSPVDGEDLEKEFSPDTVIVDKPPNPFSIFGPRFPFVKIPIPTPWWSGPNVCEEKETLDGGDLKGIDKIGMGFSRSESCQSSNTVHICTIRISDDNGVRKYVTRHHCCPGYHRDPEGPGCIPVPKRPMAEVLSQNGGSEFVELARSADLLATLERDNVTVLCPTDSAMRALQANHPEVNVVRRSLNDLDSHMISSHVIPGFHLADVLMYQQPVLTALDGTTKIHFQTHRKMVTANCVPIVRADLLAGQSVAQMVDGVVPAPKKTLAEMVRDDPDLRRWEKVLRDEGLWSQLEDPAASLTLLAPVDSALAVLNVSAMPCSGQVVRAHLAHRMVCSSAPTLFALNGRTLALRRDLNGKVNFSDVPAVATDLVATNGVLHKLSAVLVPDEAKPLLEVLAKKNYTKFVKLVERAGLKDRLNALRNVTVFVPSDAAIAAMKVEEIEEPDALKQLLMHHVVEGSGRLTGRSKLRTVDSESPALNVDRRLGGATTVDCGLVSSLGGQACGNVRFYRVSRVLVPATRDLLHTLDEIPQASHFVRLLRNVSSLASLLANSTLTLLVPTDDAFSHLSVRRMRQLEHDPKLAESLLKAHIIPGRTCTATLGSTGMDGLFPSSFLMPGGHTVRTLGGGALSVGRDLATGELRLGSTARVVRGDLLARNGAIHLVSQVLNPPSRHFFNHILTMFL